MNVLFCGRNGRSGAKVAAPGRLAAGLIPRERARTAAHRGTPGPILWRSMTMKRFLLGVAVSALMSTSAMAANVGVSMALFDDNFLTVLQERHPVLCGLDGWRERADRGRQERRRQAARPDQQLRRLGRRRHHRQSGRHFGHPGHDRRRRQGGRAARLRQPPADQRRHAARQSGLRRVERDRVRHAGRVRGLQAAACGGQGRWRQHLHHGRRALQPGRRPAHQGLPRHHRHRHVQLHSRDRRADGQLVARPGPEPDDQLAVVRHPVRRRLLQQRRDGDRRDPGHEGRPTFR